MTGRMIYGMPQSLDGYIASAPGGPQLPVPDEAFHRHFNERMAETAVCLYGRSIYEIMRYWENDDPSWPDVEREFGDYWRRVPKVVVSTTLGAVGPNATLVSENIDTVLRDLKASTDGIIDVAGATLAATCSRLGLIDEYWLYYHPVAVGMGKPYFAEPLTQPLHHLGTDLMAQGVVLLRYGVGAA